MPAALSIDLRHRIVDAWQKEGLTNAELAVRFSVGTSTVMRLKRRFRETGGVAPRPHVGGQPRKIPPDKEHLVQEMVVRHPDWTEEKYAETLESEHGIKASSVTVGRVIRRLGYSVKKRPSKPKKETDQTSSSGEESTSPKSEAPPLRVWYLWTKPARTSQ